MPATAQATMDDQRGFDRHTSDIPIWFAYFNRNHYHPARMHNYGEGGVRFSTELPVKEGSVVVVRLDPTRPVADDESCKPGFRNISLVEVRWCREKETAASLEYEVGGRYF